MSFWDFYLDLLARALLGMPSLVSQNWLGVWLSLFIFCVSLGLTRLVWGPSTMKGRRLQAIGIGVASVFSGWLMLFGYSILHTLHQDGISRQTLIRENKNLVTEIEKRRQGLVASDPVFSNTQGILQDFHVFRVALAGKPCTILITAPPDSTELAQLIATFSHSVSDCSTTTVNTDYPLERRMTLENTIPGVIVVHIRPDDHAGMSLAENIGSRIQTKISYEMPDPKFGTGEIVWLQFGAGTKWNSERKR